MSIIKAEMFILAIIGLLITVVSAFYYLRIIKIIYFDENQQKFDEIKDINISGTVLLSCTLIILFFLYPSVLNNIVNILPIT